ncbi:hypothetical protein EMCRGX_G028107 [Ephydatia muelleri]|eukprot:Em0020g557a
MEKVPPPAAAAAPAGREEASDKARKKEDTLMRNSVQYVAHRRTYAALSRMGEVIFIMILILAMLGIIIGNVVPCSDPLVC